MKEGKSMEKAAEDYAFQVPYDGSNKFYDKDKYAAFIAGWEEQEKEIERLKGIMKVLFYATMPNELQPFILLEWEKFTERNNL